MIAELKSIGSPIRSSVILAGIYNLSFLPMLDGKNSENILEFRLVPEDEDFLWDRVLLVCHQLDRDCVVVKATELV